MSDPSEYEMEAAREAYEEEILKDALKNISQEGVSCYLFYYGNAIQARISDCLDTAKDLLEAKHYGPSLVCSCTSIEVTIKYFILTPLMQGVFLHDEWADILAARIVSGRSSEGRNLLPQILNVYGVNINDFTLSSGHSVWQVLHQTVWKTRNKCVHRGDAVSIDLSVQALEVATVLLELARQVISKAAGYPESRTEWGHKDTNKNPFLE